MTSLAELPDDLIKMIFGYVLNARCHIERCRCDIEDYANLARTCRRFKHIEENNRAYIQGTYRAISSVLKVKDDIFKNMIESPDATHMYIKVPCTHLAGPSAIPGSNRLPRPTTNRAIPLHLKHGALSCANLASLLYKAVAHLCPNEDL